MRLRIFKGFKFGKQAFDCMEVLGSFGTIDMQMNVVVGFGAFVSALSDESA
ncbi:hypothetical protein [Methylovulum psychrotolerans]|jgi:hypothetical protein|uniref:hypothetical protein n=1 Tax=Methylovulum psychrotolerans TaxID=1704499 RepID=UPI0012FC5434|nr:hypothetical protein [Methylovulum psychrotolerans]